MPKDRAREGKEQKGRGGVGRRELGMLPGLRKKGRQVGQGRAQGLLDFPRVTSSQQCSCRFSRGVISC